MISKIIHNPEIVKTIVCLAFIKFSFYFFYYGVLSSLERMGFSFGINMLVLGVSEFAGYFLCKAFAYQINRKTLLITSNIFKGMLGLSFLTPIVSQNPWLSSLVLMLTCLLGAFNYSAITLLET